MRYSYNWRNVFKPGAADNFFTRHPLGPFEANSLTFRQRNAWWLSELSRVIYVRGSEETGETETRNLLLKRQGLEEKWFYNGKHLQCAIITSTKDSKDHFSVLVFRGTPTTIANWLYNLNTTASDWPTGGRVHAGFQQLLFECIKEIEENLKTLSGPIYYTGHSLGGALAVLTASLFTPHAVYTFGTPRIGNEDFLKSISHLRIYRLVNPKDIVATIPPLPSMLHAGTPYKLENIGQEHPSRPWLSAPQFLADHSPVNYTAQLESINLSSGEKTAMA